MVGNESRFQPGNCIATNSPTRLYILHHRQNFRCKFSIHALRREFRLPLKREKNALAPPELIISPDLFSLERSRTGKKSIFYLVATRVVTYRVVRATLNRRPHNTHTQFVNSSPHSIVINSVQICLFSKCFRMKNKRGFKKLPHRFHFLLRESIF